MSRADDVRLLLDLIPFLRRHGGVTEAELARLLNCTRDEVGRLLDRILMCGTPPYSPRDYVSVFRDGEGRIHAEFADHFRRPVAFSAREVACLKLMLEDPLLTGGDEGVRETADRLRRKLDEAAPPAPPTSTGEDDGGGQIPIHLARPTGIAQRHAATLQQAMADGKRVRIRHFSFNRFRITERVVDPWRLLRDGDRLYLLGHEHTHRNQVVRFRVDRIESVAVLDEPAGPVDPVALERELKSPQQPERVKRTDTLVVRVNEPLVTYLREAFGRRTVEERDDGTWVLRIPLVNENWLLRFVLSYGEAMEILQPVSMRARMRELLDATLAAASADGPAA